MQCCLENVSVQGLFNVLCSSFLVECEERIWKTIATALWR